jgi:hypothetical protein
MSYDKKGLGIAEMTFVSVNYPTIWQVAYDLFDTDEAGAMEIIRKTVEVHNQGLIEMEDNL